MAWGTHLCSFFGTTQDLLDILTPYFKAGLESQEYCIWIVSGRLTRERATTALRASVPDFDRYLAEGSLDIVSASEWYLEKGRLDLRRVIRNWQRRLSRAEARGFAGMRVTGTAAWLDTKKEWDTFLEYEAALNEAMRSRRMIVLCTYSLSRPRRPTCWMLRGPISWRSPGERAPGKPWRGEIWTLPWIDMRS